MMGIYHQAALLQAEPGRRYQPCRAARLLQGSSTDETQALCSRSMLQQAAAGKKGLQVHGSSRALKCGGRAYL